MNSWEITFLGLVQGLTEFLPVSSSGHLVFIQNLLGFKEPELLLDTALHLGTLLAVCLYFRVDLKDILDGLRQVLLRILGRNRHLKSTEKAPVLLFLWVVVGTLPTALIGLFFRERLEQFFGSASTVGLMLVATGLILFATRFLPEKHVRRKEIGLLAALAVGTSQGLAILPGISRSGATIACGLMCGLDRDLAGRFSFLLSIPAIMGAVLLQWDPAALGRVGLVPLLIGFISAALVGLIALRVLMGMVRQGHLYYFGPYCCGAGLLALVLFR